MDPILYFVAVSRSIKPCDTWLLSKPSHLTFRIASCITLNYTNRIRLRVTGIQLRQHMSVPDRLEGLGAPGNPGRQERPDFADKTRFEHPDDALVDPAVQFFA